VTSPDRSAGAAGIFLVPEFRSPMAAFLEEVRPDVPSLREVVFFTDWAEFLDTAPAHAILPDVAPDDIAQIQYTSGTTGFPKGAELTHRGLTNNARFYAERIKLAPGEVYVNPMPLFHTAGCAMGVLGAAQSLAAHVPVLAFDPALVLELLEAERAAVFLGVPTMMIAVFDHPDLARRDLSSLRVAVSGGAPVPAELVRRVEARLGVRFSIVFGTTPGAPGAVQDARALGVRGRLPDDGLGQDPEVQAAGKLRPSAARIDESGHPGPSDTRVTGSPGSPRPRTR
jgi:acyl-CoA synthetase (AMP-forming)/AMP-acid ligase II